MKKVLLLIPVLIFTFGCRQADASADAVESKMTLSAPAKEEAVYAASYETVDSAAAAVTDSETTEETAPIDKESMAPKIIKNGNLRFETEDIGETYSKITSLIKKHKGIVQNDSEDNGYNSVSKDLTIRIPSQNFDAFIQEISKGVPYFDTKEISSQDVTEEYIDVDSRIKTKKVLEARYLELLKKATKVSEMMEVEKQLSEIREEIEAKEGRLKYLKNRVAMSTVHLSFYKTIAEKSGATVSYGTKIWNAIKSGFNGISSFFIWLIEVWPFIVILVALIYLIRKRFKKKNKKEDV